jgi:hypothetical protein
MSTLDSEFNYDLFISYATGTDHRLAGHLKSFLESFHRTRTGKEKKLKTLNVCVDGYDFVVSAEARSGHEHGPDAKPEKVPEMIERYLKQSQHVLVLCSPESMRSQWVRDEIRFFVKHRGAERVLMALTHGDPVEKDPERFFAPEIVSENLHETGWYDLRRFYRSERHRTSRGFDDERLRLLAFLHGGKSASDIERLWAQEQRRARNLRYVIAAIVAMVTIVLGAGLYIQRRVAQEEKLRAGVEASMRYVSQAYRHQFTDPFTAAVNAYRSTLFSTSPQTKPEIAAALAIAHKVLVERRRIAHQERDVVKPGSLSFVSQASTGQRFTKLSQDGEWVLVITERRGDLFSPEVKGDAYVLNNRTLGIVKLDSCMDSTDYRLEFADFVGVDKVLVARGFHVDLFTVNGACLGSYQLQHTKTPVTAAGGMLDDVFFIAGNGAGCMWVQEYGLKGLVKPAEELGAVSNCDDKKQPDAVVRILTDSKKRFALNLFQSGRVDFFALDGKNGAPKRRSVLETGGLVAAFRPGEHPAAFALSFADAGSGAPGLARWDTDAVAPRNVGIFELPADSLPVDYLGFSADGEFLVGLDAACNLNIWNFETRVNVFARRADERMCK